MRINEPITNNEVHMQDGEALVSKTDAGGRITFVNEAFVAISGFTEAELIGQPHNLVRHPHMPKEAFADLWATIKAGKVEPDTAEISMLPQNYVKLEGRTATQMVKLMDVLDDHDDVQNVWSNFDIEEKEIVASLA